MGAASALGNGTESQKTRQEMRLVPASPPGAISLCEVLAYGLGHAPQLLATSAEEMQGDDFDADGPAPIFPAAPARLRSGLVRLQRLV
jgi:hypothetical protein